jgi:RNA polymerase sigma-70 factor, ECF subfamily
VTDLSELYRQFAPDVFRFALHLCRDRHAAEDLTSETFLRAWVSPEPIRSATVKGYLFTITRNLWLQGLRRSRRQVELGDTLPDPRPGPAALAETASQLELLLARLEQVPEVNRTALWLRAVEGLSYDEIARALGISLAAVKVKIHRARLALLEAEGHMKEIEP